MIIIVISYFSPFKKSEIAPPNPTPKKKKNEYSRIYFTKRRNKSHFWNIKDCPIPIPIP